LRKAGVSPLNPVGVELDEDDDDELAASGVNIGPAGV